VVWRTILLKIHRMAPTAYCIQLFNRFVHVLAFVKPTGKKYEPAFRFEVNVSNMITDRGNCSIVKDTHPLFSPRDSTPIGGRVRVGCAFVREMNEMQIFLRLHLYHFLAKMDSALS
jgi:hypothetical protein